jgi:hypothetical protein
MKRGYIFDCKHAGAGAQYVANFADVQRAKLCPACVQSINENMQDPRSVGDTVSEAVRLRDVKHAPSNR